MASNGTVRTLLFILHLTHILLVWGVQEQNSKNGSTILVHPPGLEKAKSEIDHNLPKYLSPLILPPGPGGTCHVDIGGHSFYTVGGGDYPTTGIPAPPPPAPKRRLQAAPHSSYIWLELGAVEVWNAWELVLAITNQNASIIIASDIDVSGVIPLPEIRYKVAIMGVCPGGWYCKLDAKSKGTIFMVGLGGDLTVKDLDLRNGYGPQGGAVTVSGTGATDYDNSGRFVALNVDFYNNSAYIRGGAVAAITGGLAYYTGCIFYLNSAPMGGAIYIGAPEPVSIEAPAQVSIEAPAQVSIEAPAQVSMKPADLTAKSKIKAFKLGNDNETRVIALDGIPDGCSLISCSSFVDSLFLMNWANEGGAMYIDDSTDFCGMVSEGFFDSDGGRIDIKNTNFFNNTAISGGGIYMAHHTSGTYGQIQDSRFTGNVAVDFGGDVLLAPGIVDMTFFFAFRTEFTGTVDSKPQGFYAGAEGIAYIVDCMAVDQTSTINCTGCYFCPPLQGMSQDINNQIRERLGVDTPWLGVKDNGCPRNLLPNICGYVPDECTPPSPSPSARSYLTLPEPPRGPMPQPMQGD